MELTEEQKAKLAKWAEEGLSLSEMQKRMNEEFGLSLTFMDARLILLDNNIKIKDRRSGASEAIDLTKIPEPAQPEANEHERSASGTVSVDIDRLKKPGAIVNGTVTFSDGVSATWFLDQAGRLGLSPSQPGYRPTESDLQSFQEELSKLLHTRGF